MAKPVKWTPEALRTYVAIMRHLERHWTAREVERFDTELDHVLSIISTFPGAVRQGGTDAIHEALVKPWSLLIYRISDDHVELLAFWDTRRDPRKKPSFRIRTPSRRK